MGHADHESGTPGSRGGPRSGGNEVAEAAALERHEASQHAVESETLGQGGCEIQIALALVGKNPPFDDLETKVFNERREGGGTEIRDVLDPDPPETAARQRSFQRLPVRHGDLEQPPRHQTALQRLQGAARIAEMFEHMRNYQELLARISTWLRPDGRLFVHIFTHRDTPYLFETEGDDEWMARNFFTGGIMPSDDLLLHFQERLSILGHWWVDGRHYEKTANAWLARMDAARAEIEPILERVYGPERSRTWWVNWRLFFLACAELWGYRDGTEWIVSHYLFAPR